MDISKRLNFENIFLFLFLILFPFGQIVRIGILQPLDLVVGAAAIYSILKKLPKPVVFKYLHNFLLVAGFSWVFGSLILRQAGVYYGLLYLIRLAAYFYFFIYVWNFARKSESNKKLLVDSLLGVSVISAIFGWIQYFMFPSIKSFFVWGWDEHLFRLVGTFLDPTFLGIIIVFGLLALMIRIINAKKGRINLVIIAAFLLISLAFTYSRASYLAFFAGLLIILYYYKKLKYFLLIAISFFVLMLILPTSKNHVLSFTRGFSGLARVENYQTTLKIFAKSPVFGVGYNNLCIAYQKYIGAQSFSSHACSGSDSSLLFILATTGTIGLIILAYGIWRIAVSLKHNSYLIILSSSFAALLVHSLFSNSFVYSWIMGYLIILTAVSLRREVYDQGETLRSKV